MKVFLVAISISLDDQVMDIPNKISKRGLIYFPDFCQLVLEKFRGDAVEEEIFRQNMFKVFNQLRLDENEHTTQPNR